MSGQYGSVLLWPAEYDLRRIPVRDPVPMYPYSLLWREGNRHPALAALRDYLAGRSDPAARSDSDALPDPGARQAGVGPDRAQERLKAGGVAGGDGLGHALGEGDRAELFDLPVLDGD